MVVFIHGQNLPIIRRFSMKDELDNQSLQLINNHLKFSEQRNRSGWAKVEQAVRLHEAMNHRPHQQEY